jgi:hypothetical protein
MNGSFGKIKRRKGTRADKPGASIRQDQGLRIEKGGFFSLDGVNSGTNSHVDLLETILTDLALGSGSNAVLRLEFLQM